MIRSLYALKNAINTHILNLPNKAEFKLKDVSPILNNYNGNDWYDYKLKKTDIGVYSDVNNYTRIPIVFDSLKNQELDEIYGMYLLLWRPYCHTSIHSEPDNDCLMKILDGNVIEKKFANSDSFSIVTKLTPGDMSYINQYNGFHRIINNNLNYAYSINLYAPNIKPHYTTDNKKNKEIINLPAVILPKSKINHCETAYYL
jgi:hypothetical protein